MELADWADVTMKASADWAKAMDAIVIVTRRNEVGGRIIMLKYQNVIGMSIKKNWFLLKDTNNRQ